MQSSKSIQIISPEILKTCSHPTFEASPDSSKYGYGWTIHSDILTKIINHYTKLKSGTIPVGANLQAQLAQLNKSQKDFKELTTKEFLNCLINSKAILAMMEETVKNNFKSKDEFGGPENAWTKAEASLLSGISLSAGVEIYGRGLRTAKFDATNHRQELNAHDEPFDGIVHYANGTLLQPGSEEYDAIVKGGKIDQTAYNEFYEHHLLPSLLIASQNALKASTKAIVTCTGLGCGCFAGKFDAAKMGYTGSASESFDNMLRNILKTHSKELQGIALVQREGGGVKGGEDFDEECNGIVFRKCAGFLGLLNKPEYWQKKINVKDSEELKTEDFKAYQLNKIVAWDPLSFIGNEGQYGYNQKGQSDDPASFLDTNGGAITNGWSANTGYHKEYFFVYDKENPYKSWGKVAKENNITLIVEDNIAVCYNNKLYHFNDIIGELESKVMENKYVIQESLAPPDTHKLQDPLINQINKKINVNDQKIGKNKDASKKVKNDKSNGILEALKTVLWYAACIIAFPYGLYQLYQYCQPKSNEVSKNEQKKMSEINKLQQGNIVDESGLIRKSESNKKEQYGHFQARVENEKVPNKDSQVSANGSQIIS